jgi:hypothetical protein
MNRYGVGRDYSELRSPIMATSEHGYSTGHGRRVGMGVSEETIKNIERGADAAGKIDKALGITKGIGEGMKCDAAIRPVGNELTAQMVAITQSVLGLSGQAQCRAFIRLSELIAKADPRVKAKRYHIASFQDMIAGSAECGAQFKMSTGESGRVTGLKNRMPPTEVLGVRVEIGKRCSLLNLIKSALETAVRIRGMLEIAPAAQRKQLFSDLLGYYLASENWKPGVVDKINQYDASPWLPKPQTLDPALVAILSAPTMSKPRTSDEDLGGGDYAGGDSGGGPPPARRRRPIRWSCPGAGPRPCRARDAPGGFWNHPPPTTPGPRRRRDPRPLPRRAGVQSPHRP